MSDRLKAWHLPHNPFPKNETLVTWGMMGKSKYPMNLTNLFIDKLLGNDLEISLNHLKKILEKQ